VGKGKLLSGTMNSTRPERGGRHEEKIGRNNKRQKEGEGERGARCFLRQKKRLVIVFPGNAKNCPGLPYFVQTGVPTPKPAGP